MSGTGSAGSTLPHTFRLREQPESSEALLALSEGAEHVGAPHVSAGLCRHADTRWAVHFVIALDEAERPQRVLHACSVAAGASRPVAAWLDLNPKTHRQTCADDEWGRAFPPSTFLPSFPWSVVPRVLLSWSRLCRCGRAGAQALRR